jgi:hypothetical protein
MPARAFDDDPVARWACPRDALRPRMLERFHVTEEVRLPRGPRMWLMWRDAR